MCTLRKKISKKCYNKVSSESRAKLINQVINNNLQIEEAACLEGIKISTAKAILKIYKLEGRIDKKKFKTKLPEKDYRKIFNRTVISFSKTLNVQPTIQDPRKFFTTYSISVEVSNQLKQQCRESLSDNQNSLAQSETHCKFENYQNSQQEIKNLKLNQNDMQKQMAQQMNMNLYQQQIQQYYQQLSLNNMFTNNQIFCPNQILNNIPFIQLY